jgi:hypothetical protein
VIASVLDSGCCTHYFARKSNVPLDHTDLSDHYRAAVKARFKIRDYAVLSRVIRGPVVENLPDLHRTSNAIEFVEALVHPPADGDFVTDVLVYLPFVLKDDRRGIADDILDKIEILLFAEYLGDIG